MTAPMVTSRSVAPGASRSFEAFRWNAPSKTMIATESPTTPASGSTPPKDSMVTTPSTSGPTTIPAKMRNRTLGTWSRSASTCAATPSAMMVATMGMIAELMSYPPVSASVGTCRGAV